MKNTKKLLTILLAIVVLTGCKKDKGGILGGSTSPMGEVGNTFKVYPLASVSGVGGITASIIDLNDGVSTIEYVVPLTNNKISDVVEVLSTLFPANLSYSNDTVKGVGEVKFTNEGMSLIFPEGELILVKYNAKVGDEYKLKIGDNVVKHKVVSRSTDDDFLWAGGFWIKVIKVEATSTGPSLPGLEKMTYYFNHRFGFVGTTAHFSDKTTMSADFESNADNF